MIFCKIVNLYIWSIFFLLVYYVLILNMASAILKIFHLFLISSLTSIDINKIYAFSVK